ncbi:MAG: hypothetical protein HY343_04270 [Lentisphaerae bacterium]|nr:hypothetical protein [Lentisphaerota bacterium]
MDAEFHNPYRGPRGQWLRGVFHCHCKEGSVCGSVPLAEAARLYRDIGADFLAVTDHNRVTELGAVEAATPELVFLQGFEHSQGLDLLFVGPSAAPLTGVPLREALAQSGPDMLTLVCHPRPNKDDDYWSRRKILAFDARPDGIEIFNGHYGTERLRARGCLPQYTDFWDELLTGGDRLWGFANDDFHDVADFNNAFNMVWAEARTAEAIVRAAKSGRFYATTGLLLKEFTEDRGCIAITLETGAVGRFVGPRGVIRAQAEGRHFDYTATDEAYVRFEAEGEAGKLFLQPLFRRLQRAAPSPRERSL